MTTTLNKLQALLNSEITQLAGYSHKKLIKAVVCKDGTSISIQASKSHYCEPRTNDGPYSAVEVWCIRGDNVGPITEFEYDDQEPSGYVPIEQVVLFLDNHGGIAD